MVLAWHTMAYHGIPWHNGVMSHMNAMMCHGLACFHAVCLNPVVQSRILIRCAPACQHDGMRPALSLLWYSSEPCTMLCGVCGIMGMLRAIYHAVWLRQLTAMVSPHPLSKASPHLRALRKLNKSTPHECSIFKRKCLPPLCGVILACPCQALSCALP